MLTPCNQEIANEIIKRRIYRLTEIIRVGNKASAILAALRLAFIGTKESTDALMDLIRTINDKDLHETLALLVVLSPFRDDYKDELKQLDTIGEAIDQAYKDTEEIDSRALEATPLWKEIAEACQRADHAERWFPLDD